MTISIVIVNFNAGSVLRENLARLAQVAHQEPLEVIIVDNGSTDGSLDRIEHAVHAHPHLPITVIENLENRGFATACNQGINASRGEFVLCLNPDCILEADTLTITRLALAAAPQAGMAGALILNPDGSEQRGCRRELPNTKQSVFYASGLSKLFPRRFRSFNFTGDSLPETPITVPAISGAFMLVTRAALARVGLLDEKYFLHGEDLDWCRRFSDAGYDILFVPQARLTHHQGTCSRRVPIRVEWHKHRGMWRYYRKYQAPHSNGLVNATVASGIALHFAARATQLTWQINWQRSRLPP